MEEFEHQRMNLPASCSGRVCEDYEVSLLDVVMSLCDSMDLVDQKIANHHHRTAYIAQSIANEMGMSTEERTDILWAGLLHDSGAFSLKDRLKFLNFEIAEAGPHEELGYRLLNDFPTFGKAANLIRFHHTRWEAGRGAESMGLPVPVGSHVLHLADRAAVVCGKQESVLLRAKEIVRLLKEQSGHMFAPDLVEAFSGLTARPSFWLDATSSWIRRVLNDVADDLSPARCSTSLHDLAKVICRLIDFRSRFTSTHSRGVAAAAACLGGFVGLPEQKRAMLEIAGLVHDLGKLAVPLELLEKPGQFSEEDFSVMKIHPYHTHQVLANIKELEEINQWASCHHERLDGKGYPFGLAADRLCLEARLVAVADVFTALAEDRPYRRGMSASSIVNVLEGMARENKLDGDIVSLAVSNFEELNAQREAEQSEAAAEYQRLWSRAEEGHQDV